MLQQQLGAESRGDPPRVFSSTRTIFGIRSTVEQQLDEFVAREEERKAASRAATARSEKPCGADGAGCVSSDVATEACDAGESGAACDVGSGEHAAAHVTLAEHAPVLDNNGRESDGDRSDCED